jgi:hypothetical protein
MITETRTMELRFKERPKTSTLQITDLQQKFIYHDHETDRYYSKWLNVPMVLNKRHRKI